MSPPGVPDAARPPAGTEGQSGIGGDQIEGHDTRTENDWEGSRLPFAEELEIVQRAAVEYEGERSEAIRTGIVPTSLHEMRDDLDFCVSKIVVDFCLLGRPEEHRSAVEALPGAHKWMIEARVDTETTEAFDALEREQWDLEPPEDHDDWRARDLRAALAGDLEMPSPTVLVSEQGRAQLYAGQVNGMHGDSGIGKTWVAQVTAAQEMQNGHHVGWIDMEDPNEATIVGRLRLLGISDDLILSHFHYINPESAATDEALDVVVEMIHAQDVRLIVLDSIGEAFALEGLNEDKDVEVGPWIRRVLRRLADTGACVLVIDHATKANDNPLHPSGSKRKRAAITGASYLVTASKALTREHGGTLTLTTAKDRHGYHERGKVAARIEFTIYPDDGMTWHVWSAGQADGNEPSQLRFAAHAAVKAVKAYAEENGSPPSSNGVMAAMKGHFIGSTDLKRAGLELAITSGCIRVEEGPRRSTLHHWVRDFQVAPELIITEAA